MAGVKGRSGRRPDAERQRCRALIAESMDDDDWHRLFAELAERARAGSVPHIKLLLAYAFGVPAPEAGDQPLSEPVKLVEVFRAFKQITDDANTQEEK